MERDTMFATAWVFIFITVVHFIPVNTHFFDPMKLALEDFDFNDISYSKLGKGDHSKLDTNIVVFNIGHADREQIAMMIEGVEAYHPKVVGLDAIFNGPRDPHQDSVLADVVKKYKNLVGGQQFHYEEEEKTELVENYFDSDFQQMGFVNTVEGAQINERNTIRYFSPFEEYKGKKYNSFAVQLVKNYDPAKFEKLEKRHIEAELIDYSRRYSEEHKQYLVIEGDSLLAGSVDVGDVVKDKIVLLGYVDANPDDIEDKKFTPMNEKFAGKSIPDMNGIIVHANVISMILEGRYIKVMPMWLAWLLAIVVGWLHMSFFIHYYLESHIWFHLVAKLAQLASAILFVYLGMWLFNQYRIKLDMSKTLIVIVLCVDIIYFYEAFAVWMHKKFHYTTVFHQKHH
jgi:CHASE2 domain-containing sensor protein